MDRTTQHDIDEGMVFVYSVALEVTPIFGHRTWVDGRLTTQLHKNSGQAHCSQVWNILIYSFVEVQITSILSILLLLGAELGKSSPAKQLVAEISPIA